MIMKIVIELMVTPFDFESVDFLEELEITSYKSASADITNTPLLEYMAKKGKPMFVSTGAASIDEIHIAYNAISKYNSNVCLLHCTAGYPTEYHNINLKVIETLKREFPNLIIGYSGHDNGVLAPVIAYMLGATVIEKHFTLGHALKGTDHAFSLNPEGLRKQVRDLRRVDLVMGDGQRILYDFEKEARAKMGKGIYAAKALTAGTVVTMDKVCFKTPANGTSPYMINKMIGKKLMIDLEEEAPITLECFEK
jgi:N-acetylneuraminate synthase/sialic acid synthase